MCTSIKKNIEVINLYYNLSQQIRTLDICIAKLLFGKTENNRRQIMF